MTQEHRSEFLERRPNETAAVRVSFRPFDEPYDDEKMKDKSMGRYRMLFSVGMQFLKPGEEYAIGVQQGQREGYMIGDLDQLLSGESERSEWRPVDEALEVIVEESCNFRVEA